MNRSAFPVSRRTFLAIAAGALRATRLTRLGQMMSGGGTARFPAGKSAVRVPFELLANAVFIPVFVNGRGPLNFSLDTGSYNSVVASEMVRRLGVKTTAMSQGMGSGTMFTMANIERLSMTLGDLLLTTTEGAAIPMAGLSALIARRFDGDVGADVLRHMVVQIDYAAQMATFHDPAHFHYSGPGQFLPCSLADDYDPQLQGEIELPGRPAVPVSIVIDSGAGGTTLTTRFVREHQLLESLATLPSPDVGAGGGESIKYSARVNALRIGPHVVDHPLVALSNDSEGSFAHARFDVNLGGNILRRFNLIIDYPGKRVLLEPNADFTRPFTSDASGLVLHAEGADHKTFVVRGIVPGSPAAEAGVAVGDVITAMDGAPVAQYALWEFETMLQGSGIARTLTLRRGGSFMQRTLRLRPLL